MKAADVAVDDARAVEPFRRALRRAAPGLRRELPWIGCADPWAVLVSEVMLQQTSTARVIEPWRRFLVAFPTPRACADAPLSQVLRLWSGLGYPRRAKALHDAARVIVERFDATVPDTVAGLLELPGVGPYTAHAVASFAFGAPVAVLDTNVGRVLARALANRALGAREAQTLATRLLPRDGVAAFNQAMLDLGAQYCTRVPRCVACPVRTRCRFAGEGGDDPAPNSAAVSRPQTPFEGSDRQVRGRLLRALHQGALTRHRLAQALGDVDAARVNALLDDLRAEGLVSRHATRWSLGAEQNADR